MFDYPCDPPEITTPRLHHLIEVLQRVRAAKQPFDIEYWMHNKTREPCGTTCCAGGYAALDPEFRAQGLTLKDLYSGEEVASLDRYNQLAIEQNDAVLVEPKYKGDGDYNALRQFFGSDAAHVFNPTSYATPGKTTAYVVIRKIKAVLRKREEKTGLNA